MRRVGRALLGVSLAGLLTGCLAVAHEPALPMPERPPIRFFLLQGGGVVCISEEDADKMAKFLDELDAFAAARQRLLNN